MASREQGFGPGSEKLLIVFPFTRELHDLTDELQHRALSALVTAAPERVTRLLAAWKPEAALVSSRVAGWRSLLRFLHNRDIPIVFHGTADHVQSAEVADHVDLAILTPATGSELAYALEVVLGVARPVTTPSVMEVGELRIDIAARVAWLGEELVKLPPKEFDILVELARAPGQPVTAGELVRRVWPDDAFATADDVYWHVWRLRKLLGYHGPRVRVATRRGYGYLLEDRAKG